MAEQIVVLKDQSATGRARPWAEKKLRSGLLALAYDDINPAKASRLRRCGEYLEFSVTEDGQKRLEGAQFCHVRLCPVCAWRRSLKVFSNVQKVVDATEGHSAFLLLTLTVRNVIGDKLNSSIDMFMEGWHRLSQRLVWRKAVRGWYRGLEITHNVDINSSWYDTYHVHIHGLLEVSPGYFRGDNYIAQEDWVRLWREAMRLDYDPIVDVRKVKGRTGKAVAEVAKYTVKDGDYIYPEDWDLTVDTVRLLDEALDGRRLVAYGGHLMELHRKLDLDDEVDGNLLHVDEDETTAAAVRTEVYAWHTGYRQYVLRDSYPVAQAREA